MTKFSDRGQISFGRSWDPHSSGGCSAYGLRRYLDSAPEPTLTSAAVGQMSDRYLPVRTPPLLALSTSLLAFGLGSNLLAALVLFRMRRSYPGALLCSLLSAADLFALIFIFLEILAMLDIAGGVSFGASNRVTCALYRGLPNMAQALSSWTLVALSLERSLAVSAPLRHRIWASPTLMRRLSVGLILGSATYALYPSISAKTGSICPGGRVIRIWKASG